MPIPDSDLKSLASEVKSKFDVAIADGDAFFYPSEKITLQESEASGVLWQIRTVPALLKKPKATASSNSDTDASKAEETKKKKEQGKVEQNKSDVFAPPYVPNLLVKELGEHVMLLNKFCVVPQHFLMVTREFASQDLPPSPETLTLAYRIVSAHRPGGSNTELLAFYNCGATAGASQPHRHLQFVQCPPLDTTSPEAISSHRLSEEDQDKIVESDYKVPVESLLERIEKDGKEEDSVHALPLPWQHFVALLNPTAAMKKDEGEMERYIGNKFMGLLDALFRARMFAQAEGKEASGRPAFNVLITKRAMHLIPRSREEYTDLPGKGDAEGKIGNLSINSLGYAGFMLSRSIEEQEALKSVQGGVEEVLKVTGVAPVEDVTVQAGLPTTNM
ncbi:related to APA2 - ATP adenylyltransferase II [Ustilago trichophora]|uniref:Related to APA2 - ATP adenylyltransferase II n=1 Tax=Ustilago trichophora TaxID=86804 RepID=A0A5C3EA85_9BASI|nr:related to APA2 - ATP adenylyltransferase II [Ustilago trichophora]